MLLCVTVDNRCTLSGGGGVPHSSLLDLISTRMANSVLHIEANSLQAIFCSARL